MSEIRPDEISAILRQQLSGFEKEIDTYEVGTVLYVGDGIARIHGLELVMSGELIEFPGGVSGLALNLEEDQVGAVLMGDFQHIKEGDEVKRTGRIMSVPAGDALIGRRTHRRAALHARFVASDRGDGCGDRTGRARGRSRHLSTHQHRGSGEASDALRALFGARRDA